MGLKALSLVSLSLLAVLGQAAVLQRAPSQWFHHPFLFPCLESTYSRLTSSEP